MSVLHSTLDMSRIRVFLSLASNMQNPMYMPSGPQPFNIFGGNIISNCYFTLNNYKSFWRFQKVFENLKGSACPTAPLVAGLHAL